MMKSVSKSFRMSANDSENLKRISKKLNVSEAKLIRLLVEDLSDDFCKELVDKSEHKNYENVESILIQKERRRLFKNASNNFNQVAKKLNRQSYSVYSNDIKMILNELRLVINQYKTATENDIKMPNLNNLDSQKNYVASQKKDVRHVQDMPKKVSQKVQKTPVQAPKKVPKETNETLPTLEEFLGKMIKDRQKIEEESKRTDAQTNSMIKEANEMRKRDLS